MGQVWTFNEIVPFRKVRVKNDIPSEFPLIIVSDSPLQLIILLYDVDMHLESLYRCSLGCASCRILHRKEWSALPAPRDLGEESVLDGIEFGTIRRIMHYEYIHVNPFRKFHEVILDDPMGTGVGSTAVTEHDQCTGVRIKRPQMAEPYPLDVVADESGSVMACSYCHVALVPGDVIDAMRYDPTFGEGLEVMVEGFRRSHAQGLAVAPEVSDEFLFLGVDAYDGQSDLQASVTHFGDVHELGVPVDAVLHGKVLHEGSPPESEHGEYPPDEIVGYPLCLLVHLPAYLRDGQGDPVDVPVLREAGLIGVRDGEEQLHPLGMACQGVLPSATGPAYTAVAVITWIPEFGDAFVKGVFAGSHFFCNFAHGLALLHFVEGDRCLVQPSLTFIKGRHIGEILFREHIRRIFFVHSILLFFNSKVTKNSSDSQIYLTVIQHIIQFNRAPRGLLEQAGDDRYPPISDIGIESLKVYQVIF